MGQGLQGIVLSVCNMRNAIGNVSDDHMKSFTLGEVNRLLAVTINESQFDISKGELSELSMPLFVGFANKALKLLMFNTLKLGLLFNMLL